jgi:hypothetical protein
MILSVSSDMLSNRLDGAKGCMVYFHIVDEESFGILLLLLLLLCASVMIMSGYER